MFRKQSWRSSLPEIRHKAGAWAEKYPCSIALLAIILAAAGYTVDPDTPAVLLFLPAYAGLVLSFLLLSLKDTLFRFALPCLLGMCSVLCHQYGKTQDVLMAEYRGQPAFVTVRGTVNDPGVCPGITFLPAKRQIDFHVNGIQMPDGSCFRQGSADVKLYLPKEGCALSPGFGDELEITGLLKRPSGPLTEDSFDYREYLTRQNIYYVLFAGEAKTVRQGRGFHRLLLTGRDRLLNRICPAIEPEESRLLAPGILFGVRHGIRKETKQSFLLSGMVHLLSVSGTHVMAAGGLFLLLFAWLPLRLRSFVVIVLTFFYALSTGLQAPAFRAFFMFAMFLGLRAMLRRTVPLNTLFAVAAILLLFDPDGLLAVGFQFSFLIVAALLLTSDWLRFWFFQRDEELLLTPGRMVTAAQARRVVFTHRMTASVTGCIVASLISFPLTLTYQGLWSGASVLANLPAIPVNGLIFLVFIIGSLLSFSTLAVQLTGYALSFLFGLLCFISDCSTDFVFHLPPPSGWLALLFLLLVFCLLLTRTRRSLVCVCVLMLIITPFFFMTGQKDAGTLYICSSGEDHACVIILPDRKTAVFLRAPAHETLRQVIPALTKAGIKECILPSWEEADDSALKTNFSCIRKTEAKKVDETLQYQEGSLFWMICDDRLIFRLPEPDGTIVTGCLKRDRSGALEYQTEKNGAWEKVQTILPCSASSLMRFPL